MQEKKEKIKILTENNNTLNLRVSTLNKKTDKKNDKIEESKEEIRIPLLKIFHDEKI